MPAPDASGLGAARGATPPAAGSGLRQVSLARLAEFGIEPKRDLGQNFLIDDNILCVILAQLECRPDDVVLEVGAGLGVLTAGARRGGRPRSRLRGGPQPEAPLEATLAGRANVTLHFEDILKASLETLEPAPTLCASNLPTPWPDRSSSRLCSGCRGVRRYCLMVQREVAERMARRSGRPRPTACFRCGWGSTPQIVRTRQLSRSIFYPQPHVDSTLIVLDRLAPERLPASIRPCCGRSSRPPSGSGGRPWRMRSAPDWDLPVQKQPRWSKRWVSRPTFAPSA